MIHQFREKTNFLKKHRLSISIVVAAILFVSIGLIWYSTVKHQEMARIDAATKLLTNESFLLAEQTAQRNAEIQALKEAAEVAAAKDAAEQAKHATALSAQTIDSKTCNTATTHNNPALIDVVVNKKHCIQPLGYEPDDLVTSKGATLSAKAIDAYNNLYMAAAAVGQGFSVTSSFRSYGSQVATYNRWVSISGQVGADTYSARPGYSEHQTGFAFDVAAGNCKLDCFGSTSQYTWLQEHAAEYGFIQRYYKGFDSLTGYKAEEWHYRYVGVEVAKDLKAKGIKTLEEYWKVSGGDYH